MRLEERARAKINRDLRVVRKRADGYHELISEVCFAELGDALHFAPAETLTLTIDGEFAGDCGKEETNLVIKAARALQKHGGCNHGAAIHVTKNIPVGAGLGGGSADAAATLRGLNRLWNLQLPMETLQHVALSLGADVPMCLHSVPLRAAGIGEKITLHPPRVPAQMQWLLLVFPRVTLATAQVFQAYLPTQAHGDTNSANGLHGNDLQTTAQRLCPAIEAVLTALRQFATNGAQHLPCMSGSGTACFLMVGDEARAHAAAAQLAQHHPNWWVRATRAAI